VEALLKIKPAPAYLAGRLIAALKGDGDGNARSVIAENLLKITANSEPAMDALANATIKDKDVNVRITAFKALETCGKACKRTVPVLKKSVDNYDTLIRNHARKAVNAILGIKPKKAAPKKTAVKKAAPKKATAKKAAVKKAVVKKAVVKKAVVKKAAPKKSSSVKKSGK
jgi:topoisomerase IA-like protein